MKKLLCILIVFLSTPALFSQSIQFIKYYDFDSYRDHGTALEKTFDGGYILTSYNNVGNDETFLSKVDSLGNLKWSKLFSGSGSIIGQSVIQTNDSGFAVCGYLKSQGFWDYDILLIKTDSTGNVSWQDTLGGFDHDYAYCLKQTSDNGFIICGSSRSNDSVSFDVLLLKLDEAGNQQWIKYYGGIGNDGVNSLEITDDHGYIMAGYTYNYGAIADDGMLLKTDSAGNLQWLKIYGNAGNDRLLGVKQCADKGYCAAGYSNSFGNGLDDMYLIRTDSMGNLTYYKTHGSPLSNRANSIDLTSDNGFVLAGYTNPYGFTTKDMLIVVTDSTGNMKWQKTFGGEDDDQAFCVKATNDGGYIAIGTGITYSSNDEVMLVKMDSTGYAVGISHNNDIASGISLYPNPANECITIECSSLEKLRSFSIYNIQGQIIMQQNIQYEKSQIDISGFAKGLYVVQLSFTNQNIIEKFIKE